MKDLKKSTRLLNSQQRVIFFVTFILCIQIFEALFSREDFPFTQWGMYKRLHDFEPYADIFFEKNGKRSTQKVFADPWTVRRGILRILEISELERMSPEEIVAAHQRVLGIQKEKKDEIYNLLNKSAFSESRLKEIQVTFKYWRHLTFENRLDPDSQLTLYGESQ